MDSGKKKGLKEKIANLPDAPGVYLFKDAQGKIIYIGKAKSLKKRLSFYFGRYLSSKTQAMVSKVSDIQYKLTSSESLAQILEASLIKDNQPQYNVSLKDDKTFPLIRITDEEFPVVSICRRKVPQKKDASLYFGPYTNAGLLRQALKTIRKTFGFRSCKNMPTQPCLYYRLDLCPAPCIGKISSGEYKEIIRNIRMFLESKYEALITKLSHTMQKLAEEQRFEEATKTRDQLNALSAIGQSPAYFSQEPQDLKNLLRMDKLPQRIEAFDISNITGKEATGSMVSFYKGLPDKNNYRRFRIKTVGSIDDYAMLREVIWRRYSRLLKENLPLPDLVLIDGGKGHLKVAEDEIRELGINIPSVSIAKDRENIYIKGRAKPIKLTCDTPALNLIRRIRNEAHRFAQAYHQVLRRKKIIGR